MEDGSAVELLPKSGSIGVFTLRLEAPIVLGEVNHIMLPDGVALPVWHACDTLNPRPLGP